MAVHFSTIHRWDFCRALHLRLSDDKWVREWVTVQEMGARILGGTN